MKDDFLQINLLRRSVRHLAKVGQVHLRLRLTHLLKTWKQEMLAHLKMKDVSSKSKSIWFDGSSLCPTLDEGRLGASGFKAAKANKSHKTIIVMSGSMENSDD